MADLGHLFGEEKPEPKVNTDSADSLLDWVAWARTTMDMRDRHLRHLQERLGATLSERDAALVEQARCRKALEDLTLAQAEASKLLNRRVVYEVGGQVRVGPDKLPAIVLGVHIGQDSISYHVGWWSSQEWCSRILPASQVSDFDQPLAHPQG